jgi:hypothetical protein
MRPGLLSLLLGAICITAAAQSSQSPLAPPSVKPAVKPGEVILKVGDKAPDFALPNGDGKLVSLADYVSKGPVVIVFYRGFW